MTKQAAGEANSPRVTACEHTALQSPWMALSPNSQAQHPAELPACLTAVRFPAGNQWAISQSNPVWNPPQQFIYLSSRDQLF